jgi:hypothetical protein
MNTNPDEAKLALWLDDELQGAEHAEIEAWAGQHPEHLAAREEVRKWRRLMASALPADEQPPYPEFFDARVARAIRQAAEAPTVAESASTALRSSGFRWQSIFMPLAACAGMVLAFWLGARTTRPQVLEVNVEGAPKAIPVDPILYTPEKGVKAEWFSSSAASATVIVLNGVKAIPDSVDFSETASHGSERESDSTAEHSPRPQEEPGL